MALWVECLSMVRETWVQSQVMSYQRLLKWYLIPPCLTLSNIRYASRVKWSNPGNGIAPSPTLWCSSYWKGSLLVALNSGHQLYLLYLPKKYSMLLWQSWYKTWKIQLWTLKTHYLKFHALCTINRSKHEKSG